MTLAFWNVPLQSDAFDPSADFVFVGDGASFAGSGRRQVSEIFRGDVIVESTTSRTLSAADNGKIIWCTNGSATTITMPNSLLTGFNCIIVQAGAGQVAVAAGSGATIHNFDTQFKTAGQWAAGTLLVGTNAGGTSAVALWQGRTAA